MNDAEFPATRADARTRLLAFLPLAGRPYTERRNDDDGPGRHAQVSRLSPAIRHRLIDEDEVIRAVLDRHAFSSAEKFIQEVCWRTYWKGWLELRPAVWSAYRAALDRQLAAIGALDGRSATDRSLRRRWDAAVAGNTGIACFDDWVQELIATGYLHNHARMWFASIWIFTLNLPWELGADFFHRHLLDGDPASNTLSWRWVGGLQTRGKHYLARADNIRKYTSGRHFPKGLLNEDAGPLPPDDLPGLRPLTEPATAQPGLRTALWLHEDDLAAERWALPAGVAPIAIGGQVQPDDRSWLPVSSRVADWTATAFADGLARAGQRFGVPATAVPPSALAGWLGEHGVEQVVTAEPTVGPARDRIGALERELLARGVGLVRLRRDWDRAFWPHASRGFFQLRERIRPVLAELGIP